jgi:oligosaccharyltransferase complex subunit beta
MINLLTLVKVLLFSCIAHGSIEIYERGDVIGERPLIVFNEKSISAEDLTILISSLNQKPAIKSFQESSDIKLISNGDLNYPYVLILSGKVPVRPSHLLEYLSAGGSLLWALDGNLDNNAHILLKHFGLKSSGSIKDELNSDNESVFSKNYPSDHALGSLLQNVRISYKGIGLYIVPVEDKANHNDLIRPYLFAEESAKTEGEASGDQIVMAATMNSRSQGRIAVVGSNFALSDASKNSKFIKAISSWIQRTTSFIRLDSFDHYQGHQKNADAYIVKTDFSVVACLSEISADGETFHPFLPTDCQVELVMQHARERITLASNGKCLQGRIKVPDIYGRYTLKLDYTRPGLPIIRTKRMISVRPPWLDQVPRFTFAAIPYYVGWQLQLLLTCILLLPLFWSKTKKC